MGSEPERQPPIYDMLVLSGGGSKGAYGAGAAKAILAYRALKGITNPLVYIGASAGALNAYLLASGGPDTAIGFWQRATNETVLAKTWGGHRTRGLMRWATSFLRKGQPYSVYPNAALAKLMKNNVSVASLHSPLVIAVTDYTEGVLKAFYASDFVAALVAHDDARPEGERRLQHLRRVDGDELLRQALLASAAIPIFFPPVWLEIEHKGETERSFFVDGGVGNHTPTREAAYLLRYYYANVLNQPGLEGKSVVYCISQDAPALDPAPNEKLGAFDILQRTQEVYHYIHTRPIIRAWHRINLEVEKQRDKVDEFQSWIASLDMPPERKAEIQERAKEFLNLGGDGAPRVSAELLEIEPADDLGDALEFDPAESMNNVRRGYRETLFVLKHKHKLREGEYQALLQRRID